jgi:hypothetical protein
LKKKFLIILSIFILATFISSSLIADAAVSIPKEVGQITTDATKIIPKYSSALSSLSSVIKTEYIRGAKLKTKNGKELFNYGVSSGENVHGWIGDKMSFMAQDFETGNGTCPLTFGHTGWTVIVVPEPNGPAYTIRDDVLRLWSQNGGANDDAAGYPTSNQYWEGNVLYQSFSMGYYAFNNGDWYDGDFHEGQHTRAASATDENPKYLGTTVSTPATSSVGAITNTSTVTKSSSITNSNSVSRATSTAISSATSNVASQTTVNSDITQNTSSLSSNPSAASSAIQITTIRKLNVPATVALIAGIVIVVLGGAFALYWFVIKKKLAVKK